MAGADKQKQSLYFPEEMLSEIMREANRLDRSLSWTVQQAWRLAREQVRKFPSVDHRRAPGGAEGAHVTVGRHVHQSSPTPDRKPDGDEVRSDSQLRDFLRGKFEKDIKG